MSLSAAAQTRCARLLMTRSIFSTMTPNGVSLSVITIKLFEMICLEGQAGGSFPAGDPEKRENYRQSFFQFDPEKWRPLTEADVDKLMQNRNCPPAGENQCHYPVMQKPTGDAGGR